MSEINLPDTETVVKTAATYARDLAERTLATAVVAAGGVAIAAGPADMFHASFWETMGAAAIAAGGTLLKGMVARAFGAKNSASLAKGVEVSCRAARRLRQTLGRRGIFLLILGVGKTCWGIGFLAVPQPHPQGLDLLLRLAPMHCWAWLWILAGLITACSAVLRVGRDGFGFAVALIPPIVWATAYVVAVLDGSFPRGGFVAVWYLTSHVGVIMWAATVPEHSVPHAPRPARKGKAP